MTPDPTDHETEIDPTARYMAKRLSALPDSIREEVIEVVAEVVDHFTKGSGFLEGVAASKALGELAEVRRQRVEEDILLLLYVYAHNRLEPLRQRLAPLREAFEQDCRRRQNRRKGTG